MKSQDETSIDFGFSDLNSQHSKDLNSSIVKCVSGNEAFEYCFNENCLHESIFVCDQRKCKCRQEHKLCPKADLDFTIEHINKKLIDTTEMKESIQNSFDKIIDHLSQIRDRIVAEVDQKIKFNMLHEIEKKFLQKISQQSTEDFGSKESTQLWDVINKKFVVKHDVFEEVKQVLGSFNQVVQDLSGVMEIQSIKIIQNQEFVQVSTEGKFVLKGIFKSKSSILIEDEYVQRLENMFEKKIQGVQLLFKASEHKFDLKKYYEICGNVPDTIIVCQTKMGKILGGYSPMTFNPASDKIEYVTDESGQSMIFSLSQNDKFELKEKAKAIRHMPQKNHVRMGNAEFNICDKADKIEDCYTYLINQFYSNPKYKNDKESYLKLNGNDSFKFTTKEWEVWKVEFQPKEN